MGGNVLYTAVPTKLGSMTLNTIIGELLGGRSPRLAPTVSTNLLLANKFVPEWGPVFCKNYPSPWGEGLSLTGTLWYI